MHSLETLIRMNLESEQTNPSMECLRNHPRIVQLRAEVSRLPIDDEYRRWLYRSINLYAEQIVERPLYQVDEGWDDLEALQQVTLGDMMESSLQMKRKRME